MTPEHANVMARYNQWMNDNLYAVCADVPDAERKADRGLFFSSIHGTLNHLLLADKLWLGRFTHEPFEVSGLDQELFAEFDALREARIATDRLILDWTTGLTEAGLASDLEYQRASNPEPRCCPLWIAVAHFFNHQTHHRGQVTAALSQLGRDYGTTDLVNSPVLPEV